MTEDTTNTSHNPVVAAAMKEGAVPEGYKEIDVEFFQFKTPGDNIEGRLISKNTIQIRGARIGKYTIHKSGDKKLAFLGSVQLDELLANVALGSQIMVMYIAEEILENLNKMKRFKLYVKTT
jgi:hypothetical protein